jgi:hypothetical protein
VAGEHAGRDGVRRVGKKLEGQAFGVLGGAFGRGGQPEGAQAVEEAALGGFELIPTLEMTGHGQVGDGEGEPAGEAERVLVFLGDGPVADLVSGVVGAEAVAAVSGGGGGGTPESGGSGGGGVVDGVERGDKIGFGEVGEQVSAGEAGVVLEIDEVVTVVAAEEFHGGGERARGAGLTVRRSGSCASDGWFQGGIGKTATGCPVDARARAGL